MHNRHRDPPPRAATFPPAPPRDPRTSTRRRCLCSSACPRSSPLTRSSECLRFLRQVSSLMRCRPPRGAARQKPTAVSPALWLFLTSPGEAPQPPHRLIPVGLFHRGA
uniref:Uncharacterized protein n=1 Tax=Triticum urartu TaxID=4572 RepID=A0A8R7JZ55_TRIUA